MQTKQWKKSKIPWHIWFSYFHHIAAPFLTTCKGSLGSFCSSLKRSRVCVTPQIHISIDMHKVSNTRYILTKCEVKTCRVFYGMYIHNVMHLLSKYRTSCRPTSRYDVGLNSSVFRTCQIEKWWQHSTFTQPDFTVQKTKHSTHDGKKQYT